MFQNKIKLLLLIKYSLHRSTAKTRGSQPSYSAGFTLLLAFRVLRLFFSKIFPKNNFLKGNIYTFSDRKKQQRLLITMANFLTLCLIRIQDSLR